MNPIDLIRSWPLEKWTAEIDKVGLLDHLGTAVSVEPAGPGFMNVTLRVRGNRGTAIVAKQSPPFCAFFPDIPADTNRILAEAFYFKNVSRNAILERQSPTILHVDDDRKIVWMEDLGQCQDFELIYLHREFTPEEIGTLLSYLARLHDLDQEISEVPFNLAMRELNHRYIFELPFTDTPYWSMLDKMTPGFSKVVFDGMAKKPYSEIALALGSVYFQDAPTLVHGDFYPRSWVKVGSGNESKIVVLDSEFCFFGRAEWDYGVLLAHAMLAGQATATLVSLLAHIDSCICVHAKIERSLIFRFAAVEVIRRLVYISQLPISPELEWKTGLLRSCLTLLETASLKDAQNICYWDRKQK
ncbi:MAG: hypothetical protein COT74_00640 [Bdellovibrionales bacterium CG10_big_fil_rev_8_21_14_0_10_45_34]|nr:MAG: hypothetical protein COT74_00640 [Bdellovibrionales bacterium CG10_big_fil_rev_8_21_14_0_10_45_34]